MDISKVKDTIRGARHLNFVYKEKSSKKIRVGNGRVKIRADQPQGSEKIICEEAGFWKEQDHAKPFSFSNVYQWQFSHSSFTLSHLRQGEDSPVQLLEFTHNQGRWLAKDPHVCGEDTYVGELELDDHLVNLKWYVKGPEKDYNLEIEYW
jgi:hypothetical protein